MTHLLETHVFVIKTFAAANPIYCLSLWNTSSCGDPHSDFAYRITRFLTNPEYTPTLLGNPSRVQGFFAGLNKFPEFSQCPNVTPVFHVFPVYSTELDVGLMVPLEIAPDEEWHISDAFGTFGFKNPTYKRPPLVFHELLQRIEKAWLECHPDRVLPLRWRRAFSLHLLCPVHMNTIEGESLQAPLVIALLRAISERPATKKAEAVLPFGNGPIFATGTLQPDHTFGPIESLERKLEAFVREYGEGLPAILTSYQIKMLEATDPGKGFLRAVKVYQADDLPQLFGLLELKEALDRLCEAPHPTEIDHLLASMRRMQQGIRFNDVEAMSKWLLPDIESPVYRFQLVRQAGLIFAHRGQFSQSQARFDMAADILSQHPHWFGVVEKIQLATAWGTLAFDACDVSSAEPSIRMAQLELPYAPAAEKARFWGTCCQLYRLAGRLDEAVEAGRRAISYTDQALASEGGRDRNYLVHALLARARSNPIAKAGDLAEAAEILRQSQNEWAPLGNTRARQAHLGFCLHYEAEIARLQDRPFYPPEAPPWSGTWGHPWMFVLLSCARNPQHTGEERIHYARRLVAFAISQARHPDSLFSLFLAVYRIYLGALPGENLDVPLGDMMAWCRRLGERGFPGWQRRLSPYIDSISMKQPESVEALCDAIPYH